MGRILVTGATGFVGGRVAARLRGRGDEVVALTRRHDDALAALDVEQRQVGLTDAAAIEQVLAAAPVDGIVHAAATAGPDLDAVRVVNRDGTRAVVDAALAAGVVRVVHVSTTSVYDLDAIGDTEVAEDAPLVVATSSGGDVAPYSLTKAEAEGEVVRAVVEGLDAQILRPPAVLGAGPTSTWGTRVPQRYRDGELPPRPPAMTFGYVHVEDLVDAVLASLEAAGETGTCNVVGGHTTFGEYLAALRTFLDGPAAAEAASTDVPWRGRYASARLPELLGVRPGRTFEEALDEIAASWSTKEPEGT